MENTIEVYKLPWGKYEGHEITSKKIPRSYLVGLEEYLLLEKKEPTTTRLMQELDKELKRRKK